MDEDHADTILVVDDEETSCSCRVNLEFEGFLVVTASGGVEGLDRLVRSIRARCS